MAGVLAFTFLVAVRGLRRRRARAAAEHEETAVAG
jgi:hypothetical protein